MLVDRWLCGQCKLCMRVSNRLGVTSHSGAVFGTACRIRGHALCKTDAPQEHPEAAPAGSCPRHPIRNPVQERGPFFGGTIGEIVWDLIHLSYCEIFYDYEKV